jgi:hypothetical protein
MTVRKLVNSDWTFGGSSNDLIDGDDEIAQNVVTRLRSFKNDWFLDTEANIDWIKILGSRNNRKVIIKEVYRVTQNTEGVWKVPFVDVSVAGRDATIKLTFLTVNSKEYKEEISI